VLDVGDGEAWLAGTHVPEVGALAGGATDLREQPPLASSRAVTVRGRVAEGE